jgi:hypothetical protein
MTPTTPSPLFIHIPNDQGDTIQGVILQERLGCVEIQTLSWKDGGPSNRIWLPIAALAHAIVFETIEEFQRAGEGVKAEAQTKARPA